MELDELIAIISGAGASANAIEYAEVLLPKINRLEAVHQGKSMLRQLRAARNAGDLRGRLLEVNFADLFLQSGHTLKYGVKQRQGMVGDVDFCWDANSRQIYFELKLLGEVVLNVRDMHFAGEKPHPDDIVRLQRDLMSKSTTKKFDSAPEASWINLVAIDVSELQFGTVDLADCLLAAGGNPLVSQYCFGQFEREDVVGVFEKPSQERPFSQAQLKWISEVIRPPVNSPHPRSYIHGALFLFRSPSEKAALSYDLSAALVWNAGLIAEDVGKEVASAIHSVIPEARL